MWLIIGIIVALIQASITRSENFNFDNNNEPLQFPINRIENPYSNDQLEIISSDLLPPPSPPLSSSHPIHQTKFKYQIITPEEIFQRKQFLNPRDDTIDDRPEAERISLIENDDNDDDDDNNNNNNNNNYEEDNRNRDQLDQLSNFLTGLLKEPGKWEAPLILVEEPLPLADNNEFIDNSYDNDFQTVFNSPLKRSRYYRRYPWKRQNSRSRYDYDSSRYLCTPTKQDVFQLLLALHDARQGNKSKTVNFCNRRRPAGSVFTNIRFLGRRRK